MKFAIFNTTMVRAILDGRKNQTRRACKVQPNHNDVYADQYNHNPMQYAYWALDNRLHDYLEKTPYKVGDIIYVRETFIRGIEYDENDCPLTTEDGSDWIWKTYYRADDALLHWVDADGEPINPPWKPSIHMPKEYARLFLRVKDVRIERLNEISEEDAQKEGIEYAPVSTMSDQGIPSDSFGNFWESIYGKGSFDNRYVLVIEFERISKEEAING